MAKLYDTYSFEVIPRLGKWVAGDDAPYRYLVESIRTFPPRETFRSMVQEAGYSEVSANPMTGGIVVLYDGRK